MIVQQKEQREDHEVIEACVLHNASKTLQHCVSVSLRKCTRKLMEPRMYPTALMRSAMARRVMIFWAPVRISFRNKNVAMTRKDPMQDSPLEAMAT